MTIYLNKRTGLMYRVAGARAGPVRRLELQELPSEEEAGEIIWTLHGAVMGIDVLGVEGRSGNRATQIHPCPGAGSLLMLLACRQARELGAGRVLLFSVKGAQGFYRRMGLHHPAAQRFAVPLEPAQRSREHRLDAAWLNEFAQMFEDGRQHGWLESDLGSAIANLERHVDAYWRPRRWLACGRACAIA